MFKKIAATAAIAFLSATVLTGCSGKMSADETCTYINEQVKEKELDKKLDEAGAQLMSGDTEGYAATAKELEAVMADAAGKTEDEKFAQALDAVASQSKEMVAIIEESDGDLMKMSEKAQAMDTEKAEEATSYLDEVCPNVGGLN